MSYNMMLTGFVIDGIGSLMMVSVPLNLCCLASLLASDLLRIGLPFRAAIASLTSSSEEGTRGKAVLPVHQRLILDGPTRL